MAEKTLNFHKLSDCVIKQLKKQNNMDSTLMVYRRIYNRIYSLMKKLGIETYTPEIGRQFLDSVNVCRSTFSAYTCAVRRLNDYIDDIIQIGAVMVDGENRIVDEFSSYVQPEYGRIDSFIQNLTGIAQEMVENAPNLSSALMSFSIWIGDRDPVVLSY